MILNYRKMKTKRKKTKTKMKNNFIRASKIVDSFFLTRKRRKKKE